MLYGFTKVISTCGAVVAVLLVLFIVGSINNKGAHGMAAVGDGLGDVIKWALALFANAVSHL